jgi:hypothetical protein
MDLLMNWMAIWMGRVIAFLKKTYLHPRYACRDGRIFQEPPSENNSGKRVEKKPIPTW